MTTTKSYDLLNRLQTIASVGATSAASPAFDYEYNAANQRVRVTQADGSYWRYEYDTLGQVKSGKRYWSDGTPVVGQQFEYAFDDIGNRTQTKAGGDSNGANLRPASYSANTLNQYTSRVVPGTNDVSGLAYATATVQVNGSATARQGEYFAGAATVNNSTGSVFVAVTTQAVLTNTTNTVLGNLFFPKTPETFLYDADGNLKSDGRWTNQWDAENRLVYMETLLSVPTGAVMRLSFQYDWMGRRVSKVVQQWNGTTWPITVSNRFLYDGWNLVAELNATNNALIRSYVWGQDLSGSEKGAGGVGGLLFVTAQNVSTNAVAYDANGNVEMLVDVTSGNTSAQYEYGPFGEVVRASGVAAKVNPIRFSTKYADEETGFCYYGYRFYDAGMGRWPNRDPLGEFGGVNLYAFVGNRPVDVVDLYGLAWTVKKISGEAFPMETASKFRWAADPVTIAINSAVTESSIEVVAGGAYKGIFRLIENLFDDAWPLTAQGKVELSCDDKGNIIGESDESLKSRDGISAAGKIIVSKQGSKASVSFGAAATFKGKLKFKGTGKIPEVGDIGFEIDGADLQLSRTRTATFECQCKTP